MIRPLVAVAAFVALVACSPSLPWPPHPVAAPSSSPPTAPAVATVAPAPTSCIAVDGKADRACTPGVANPAVTQATIGSTICRRGWTATVRPPSAYTEALKRKQRILYGETGIPLSGLEEDHELPLEGGGNPTDPRNLWPEPRSGANGAATKDAAEATLKRDICTGTKTLAAAQHDFLAEWTHG